MTKEPSPETKHAHADPTPTARQRTSARRIIAFAVFGVAVLVLGIPLWASLTYRWAVDDLHVELSTISIQSTKTVNAEVDNCWAGIAPASVRYIFPVTGDIDMNAARDSFADALISLGFTAQGDTFTRPRNDSLNADMVTITLQDTPRLEVVGDVFDNDMVFCFPW